MEPTTLQELADEINRKRKKWRTVPWITGIGVAITVASIPQGSAAVDAAILWTLILIGGAMFDRKRRGVKVNLEVPQAKESEWAGLLDAFKEIRSCREHWTITGEESYSKKERKRRGGSEAAVDTNETDVNLGRPKNLISSIQFPAIPYADMTVYVTPFGLLIDHGKFIEAASKRDASFSARGVNFRLNDMKKPKDAKIVGHTWKYVNASGGADRRYKENPEIPIAEFEQLDFTGPNGESGSLMFSCVGGGRSFVNTFRRFRFTQNGKLGISIDADEEEVAPPNAPSAPTKPQAGTEGLGEIVARYTNQIEDKKIHFAPNIPKKLLQAALSSYATQARDESVIALLDDTAFGGGREGLIVTSEAIYLKELFGEPKRIALSDIDQFSAKGGLMTKAILVDGDKVATMHMPANAAVQGLGAMIGKIIDYKRAEKQRSRPGTSETRSASQESSGSPPPTMQDILDKLDSLYEQGLITKEQYEAKRKKTIDVLG